MAETFEILARFLARCDDEVEGRELSEPGEETKSRLQQLARGDLAAEERSELLAQLSRNTEWISWLAQEVKSLRSAVQ